jgi:hypothetical protein
LGSRFAGTGEIRFSTANPGLKIRPPHPTFSEPVPIPFPFDGRARVGVKHAEMQIMVTIPTSLFEGKKCDFLYVRNPKQAKASHD